MKAEVRRVTSNRTLQKSVLQQNILRTMGIVPRIETNKYFLFETVSALLTGKSFQRFLFEGWFEDNAPVPVHAL